MASVLSTAPVVLNEEGKNKVKSAALAKMSTKHRNSENVNDNSLRTNSRGAVADLEAERGL